MLHLQPRQMRLEITDLKDDSGSGKSGRKDRSYKGMVSMMNTNDFE